MMTRILIVAFFIMCGAQVQAQADTSEKSIKKTIETFFEALHKGDSSLMKTVIHKTLHIQTTRTTREGKKILLTETKEKLLDNVAKKKPTDTYYEKLLTYDIKIDGNLASVWTPYEFYYNGRFSHCGANSFQLFNNNGKWEIIYLVDMRRRQGCTPSEGKK